MAIYDGHFGGYRVFVGDLGRRATRYDVEKEFEVFGPLLDLWVARNPPGFAFLVYKHADDAEKAVRKLHGRMVCGRRVRVEHARPFDDRRPRSKNPSDRPGYGSRSPGRGGGGGGGYPPRGSPPRYGDRRQSSHRSYSPSGGDSRRRSGNSPDVRRASRSSPSYAPRGRSDIGRNSASPDRRSRSPVPARSRSPVGVRRSPSPGVRRSISPRRQGQSPIRRSLTPSARRLSPRSSLSPNDRQTSKYSAAYDNRGSRRGGSRSHSPVGDN